MPYILGWLRLYKKGKRSLLHGLVELHVDFQMDVEMNESSGFRIALKQTLIYFGGIRGTCGTDSVRLQLQFNWAGTRSDEFQRRGFF